MTKPKKVVAWEEHLSLDGPVPAAIDYLIEKTLVYGKDNIRIKTRKDVDDNYSQFLQHIRDETSDETQARLLEGQEKEDRTREYNRERFKKRRISS